MVRLARRTCSTKVTRPTRRGSATAWNTRSRSRAATRGWMPTNTPTAIWIGTTSAPRRVRRPAPSAVRQTFAVASRHPTPVRYPGMPAERYLGVRGRQRQLRRCRGRRHGSAAHERHRIRADLRQRLVPRAGAPAGRMAIHQVRELRHHRQLRRRRARRARSSNPNGTQWTMYSITADADFAGRLTHAMFLPDSLDGVQEGAILEETMLARDEMANLAWAIEHTVQGASGEPLDRDLEAKSLAFQQRIALRQRASTARSSSIGLQTPVPANWTPLLPVRDTPLNLGRPVDDPPGPRRHEALLSRGERRGDRRGRSRLTSDFLALLDARPTSSRVFPSATAFAPTFSIRAAGCCDGIRAQPMPDDDTLLIEEEEVPRIGATPQAQVPVRAQQRRPQLAVDRAQQERRTRRSRERPALRCGGEDDNAAIAGRPGTAFHANGVPSGPPWSRPEGLHYIGTKNSPATEFTATPR